MSALNETPDDAQAKGERIAKVIARSGLCSRRDAEVLIGEKRVSVNGEVIDSAALDVLPSDKVLVDGKPLAAREPPRLWRYHKPKGRVTTHKDPEGRPTVFEALPEGLPRLISVGRLDFNTEGLLLLTNDGDLARHLELPSTGWTRRYRVRAFGEIEQAKLDELAGGLRTGGVSYGPIEATLEREQGDNVWITLSIREGKNREVRRIMEHLGLTVNRLIRVSFGPFMLGELEPGQIEEVKTSVLKDQLGPRLARQLGVKREPVREERRLPAIRSKPTYLRRKPSPAGAPERAAEERPMRRRRILDAEGAEAPRIDLVPEKKRRPDRFKAGEGGEERRSLRRGGEGIEREGGQRRFGRGEGRRQGERQSGRGRQERSGEHRRGEMAGEAPRWRSRREHGSEERGFGREGGQASEAIRKREGARDGERRPYRGQRPEGSRSNFDRPKSSGTHFERREHDRRSKHRHEGSGEVGSGAAKRGYKARRTEDYGSGERPESPDRRRRFQRREEGHEEKRRTRPGREPGARGPERDAEGRPSHRGEGRMAKRRAEGGARGGGGKAGSFAKREGGNRAASTRGESGKGKSFKRRDSFAQKPRSGNPRKPRPETGEENP